MNYVWPFLSLYFIALSPFLLKAPQGKILCQYSHPPQLHHTSFRALCNSFPSLFALNPISLPSFSHPPFFLFYLSSLGGRCVIKTHCGGCCCWGHVKRAVQWMSELCWMVPIILLIFSILRFDNVCLLLEMPSRSKMGKLYIPLYLTSKSDMRVCWDIYGHTVWSWSQTVSCAVLLFCAAEAEFGQSRSHVYMRLLLVQGSIRHDQLKASAETHAEDSLLCVNMLAPVIILTACQ